jgi:hypothetical protein
MSNYVDSKLFGSTLLIKFVIKVIICDFVKKKKLLFVIIFVPKKNVFICDETVRIWLEEVYTFSVRRLLNKIISGKGTYLKLKIVCEVYIKQFLIQPLLRGFVISCICKPLLPSYTIWTLAILEIFWHKSNY